MDKALKFLTVLVGTVMICFTALSLSQIHRMQQKSILTQASLTPEIREAIEFIENEAVMPFELYEKRSVVEHKYFSKYKGNRIRYYGCLDNIDCKVLKGVYLAKYETPEYLLKRDHFDYVEVDRGKSVYFIPNMELPDIFYEPYAGLTVYYDLENTKLRTNEIQALLRNNQDIPIEHVFLNRH